MSDLISRKALLEEIKENQWGWFSREMMILMLENQPSVTDTNVGGKWIPCSERLPENNKPCLCWVESTTIASGETFIIGSCSNGFWFLQTYEIGTHSFPVKDYKVVAWMPLPEPYKTVRA